MTAEPESSPLAQIAALEQLVQELQQAQRVAGFGTWRLDLVAGGYSWSPSLHELCGTDPATFQPVREHRWLLCHPDDRHLLAAAGEAIEQGAPFRLRYRIVRPDGTVRWIQDQAEPQRAPDGRVVAYLGAVRDCTAETEYQAALELERHRLAEAQAVAKVGHWDWDITGGGLTWSEETYRIFGVDPATFTPTYRTFLETVSAADRARVETAVQAALDGRAPYRVRHGITRPDGGEAVVQERAEVIRDPSGAPVRMIGTAQDITEQARTEAALRNREERLNRAQAIGLIGDWVWDLATRTATWSDQMFRMYGLDPAQGHPDEAAIVGMYHPDDRAAVLDEQRRAIRGETDLIDGEFRIVRPDGEVRWIRRRAVVTRDADGRAVRIQGTNQDITERALAEAALRDREERLNRAQEIGQIGDWVWDVNQRTVAWSPQMFRIFGFDPSGPQPPPDVIASLYHPDDQAWMVEDQRRAIRSGAPSFEHRHRIIRPDGSVRWSNVRAVLTRNAAGRVVSIQGTNQDITDLARREAELQRLTESLARGELMASLGSYEWDRETDTLWWSDQIYRIYGFAPGSVVPSHDLVVERAHPDDRKMLRATVREAFRAGDGWDMVQRLRTVTGEERVVREIARLARRPDGRVRQVHGTAQDITEQVRLLEQVEAQAAEVTGIINASPLPTLVIDEHGTIGMVNAATERTLGWRAEELRGQNVAVLAAGVSRDEHDAYMDRYLATGQASTQEGLVIGRTREVRARHRDGSEFPAQLTVAETIIPGGGHRFIGILLDLTEQKATEEHLRRVQKTEALGTLVAGVAHDFNNLLTAIRGGLEMAERAPGNPHWLQIADQAAGRATELVRHLLRFGRRGEAVQAPVAPADLVRETTLLVRETLDRRIWFDVSLEEDLPSVSGDAGQLQQVLMNLVLNACDAVLERASAMSSNYHPAIYLRAQHALGEGGQHWVVLEVEDNGVGMSEEVQARAFDPFFTTKAVDQGTGLGLAMASGIIEQHRGRISIESVAGSGTTISIRLPVLEAEDEIDTAAADHADTAAPRGTVLVVDDEETLAEVSAAFLSEAGFETVVAIGGTQALNFARAQRFDMVVLDLNMPAPNGWEVLTTLRAEQPQLPVLIVSGYLNPMDARARGVDFLPKPFGRSELVEAVRRVLHGPRPGLPRG